MEAGGGASRSGQADSGTESDSILPVRTEISLEGSRYGSRPIAHKHLKLKCKNYLNEWFIPHLNTDTQSFRLECIPQLITNLSQLASTRKCTSFTRKYTSHSSAHKLDITLVNVLVCFSHSKNMLMMGKASFLNKKKATHSMFRGGEELVVGQSYSGPSN